MPMRPLAPSVSQAVSRCEARGRHLLTGACLALVLLPVSAATDIVAHPADGQNGIARALEQARGLRAQKQARGQAIRIVLKPGLYVFDKPLRITAADSGTADAPLLIEAEKPGSVTFSGAPPLKLAAKDKNRWYFKPPQGVNDDEARGGGQFFVNDARAVLAREPDAGKWWFVRAPSKDTLFMDKADAARASKLLDGTRDRAIVRLMQSWTSGDHRAGKQDDKFGVPLQPRPRWPMLMYGAAQRYFIANVPGALDAAGEWLAADGRITYIPTSRDLARAGKSEPPTAFWPRMPTLLRIQGDDGGEGRVQHVTIKGVRFAHTASLTPAQGWTDGQAAVDIGAAIEVDKARHVRIQQCELEHLGGYGVWLRASVQQSEVSACRMSDLGAGGVKIGEARTNPERATNQNTVRDNLIMHTGQDYPGAVGVWIGRSGRNVVERNVIAHTTYTGISVGWEWGYEPQDADGNRIVNNVLLDIGQHMLSDLGAIYTLGPGKGTTISGNFIRHVRDYSDYGSGAWGIYNDEGSSDLNIDNNVVVGTNTGGYHLHYGRGVTVLNNLFSGGRQAEVTWSNPDKSGDWTLRGQATSSTSASQDVNVGKAKPEAMRKRMGRQDSDDVAHVAVKAQSGATDVNVDGGSEKARSAWSGVIGNARKTIDAAGKRFGLEASAFRIPEEAASSAPAAPPALTWNWDFSDSPLDIQAPEGLLAFPRRTADPLIKVERDPAGGADHCLMLRDGAPGILRFEPYVFVKTNLPSIGSSARFLIKLDPGSEIVHEWRDKTAQDYRVLFSIGLSPAKGLTLNGAKLGQLAAGKWLDVTVQGVAKPGGQAALAIAIKSEEGKVFQWKDVAPLDPNVPQVKWVGWISNGLQAAGTCLKAIVITPPGG